MNGVSVVEKTNSLPKAVFLPPSEREITCAWDVFFKFVSCPKGKHKGRGIFILLRFNEPLFTLTRSCIGKTKNPIKQLFPNHFKKQAYLAKGSFWETHFERPIKVS
ncbi:MAG: hypothetical protein A2007_03930 [Verrucomicrobia bacterium GWC2_42_7]|nr:MAG: hypothetical protein A2007_03930 [Verrucomicrobia bacterium GWC2_42_7]